MIVNLNDPVDLALLAFTPTSNLNRPPKGLAVRKIAGRSVLPPAQTGYRFPYIGASCFTMPTLGTSTIHVMLSACANDSEP